MTMARHPSPQLMRRHHFAMTVVHKMPPEQRVSLLYWVIVGSEKIDRALRDREEANRRKWEARHVTAMA